MKYKTIQSTIKFPSKVYIAAPGAKNIIRYDGNIRLYSFTSFFISLSPVF